MSRALDAAELLWNCLANVSGGDWEQHQSPEWREAARRARAAYHKALDEAQQARLRRLHDSLTETEYDHQRRTGRPSDQRILDVLKSDYEMVLRLAADRLGTLNAMTWPSPTPGRHPFCADHPDADVESVCEVCVEHENECLREQLKRAETECLKLAREVDTLTRDRAALTLTVENYREAMAEADHKVQVLSERLTWVRGDKPGTVQVTDPDGTLPPHQPPWG